MSERPTHEFKTSSGTVYVIRDFYTPNDAWEVNKIHMTGISANDAGLADVAKRSEIRGFELLILSIDGSTENIADKIMNGPIAEYHEVVAHVTPIIEGKKKSQTS